jgi:hypothetical protein
MKQKSLLVAGLFIILVLILFTMVGCGPVKHTKTHYSYRPTHHQPRTYVQFDHFWFNNRPYIQPRIIVVQPRQPRVQPRQPCQPIRRGKK